MFIQFFQTLFNAFRMANNDRNNAKQIKENHVKAIESLIKKEARIKKALLVIEEELFCFPKISRTTMVKPVIDIYYAGIRNENGSYRSETCMEKRFETEIQNLKNNLEKIKKLYKQGKFSEIVKTYGENKVGKLEYPCDNVKKKVEEDEVKKVEEKQDKTSEQPVEKEELIVFSKEKEKEKEVEEPLGYGFVYEV